MGAGLTESDEMAEAEACLREALELCEETDDVFAKQTALRFLSNMSGRPDLPVGRAEAATLRLRLNALYAQAGRNQATSCTICLETLEHTDGGAEKDAADDGGRGADGFTNSAVFVMQCAHQFQPGAASVPGGDRMGRALFARSDSLHYALVCQGAFETAWRPRLHWALGAAMTMTTLRAARCFWVNP